MDRRRVLGTVARLAVYSPPLGGTAHACRQRLTGFSRGATALAVKRRNDIISGRIPEDESPFADINVIVDPDEYIADESASRRSCSTPRPAAHTIAEFDAELVDLKHLIAVAKRVRDAGMNRNGSIHYYQRSVGQPGLGGAGRLPAPSVRQLCRPIRTSKPSSQRSPSTAPATTNPGDTSSTYVPAQTCRSTTCQFLPDP
jgi:hypothetical protein